MKHRNVPQSWAGESRAYPVSPPVSTVVIAIECITKAPTFFSTPPHRSNKLELRVTTVAPILLLFHADWQQQSIPRICLSHGFFLQDPTHRLGPSSTKPTMGVLFSTIRGALNLLLPFTNPQTPLLQDIIHAAILFGTLYYAPQIAEHYRENNRRPADPAPHGDTPHTEQGAPLEENHILDLDTDEEEDEEDVLEPRQVNGAPPAPRVEDEEQQWQNENDFANAGEGPANDRPRPTAANRTVGTKKAKSLARRDQRRAYHEFHRSQAEQRRLAEAAGREEREKALAEEKARRADKERVIAEKMRIEREKRKEEERREVEEERERRERAISRVREEMERKGAVNLGQLALQEGKDNVWIEKLVRASGLIEKVTKEKEGSKVLITGESWLVRIDAELMRGAYAEAVIQGKKTMDGRVSFAHFGEILQKAVLARSQDA